MDLRLVDWIWSIRGRMPLLPGQLGDDAFDSLDPLFHQTGTSYERSSDTLTFTKKDPAAQDKMSVFDSGILQVENSATGLVLRYRLTSRLLLLCFLAPLLFLSFAQLTIAVGKLQKASTDAATKSEKADAKKKAKDQYANIPMNPIDKFLGAPAPEEPKKGKSEADTKKPSPTAAYVFAGVFAVLYAGGRVLEDRLVKSLFERRLLDQGCV